MRFFRGRGAENAVGLRNGRTSSAREHSAGEDREKGNKQIWSTGKFSQVKEAAGRTFQVKETAQIKEKRNLKIEYV